MSERTIYMTESAFLICKPIIIVVIGTTFETFIFPYISYNYGFFLHLFEKKFCSLNIMCKFAIPNRKKWCWFGSSAG